VTCVLRLICVVLRVLLFSLEHIFVVQELLCEAGTNWNIVCQTLWIPMFCFAYNNNVF